MSSTSPDPCCPPEKESGTSCCQTPDEPSTDEVCCLPSPPEESRCCPPKEESTSCCTPEASEPQDGSCCAPRPDECCPDPDAQRRSWERPGHQLCPFVTGWVDTPVGQIPQISTKLEWRDTFGSWQMRWGIGRDRYRISPGLYAIGNPDSASPVLVTANYKLSFDHLRRELGGLNCWLLILETFGINVWCAAGKGTFGTEEIIARVKAARLDEVVQHRQLILPQLGAPGVAAHLVKKGCGFLPRFGPVRAMDLPAYLEAGNQATAEMRRVQFTTLDRLVLTPVELTGLGKQSLYALLAVFILGGIGPSIFSLTGVWYRGGAAMFAFFIGLVAGAVATPVLLPWIPGKAFALKGALVGVVFALFTTLAWPVTIGTGSVIALLLSIPAVSSWYAMNFTGSSTYTSPSGVEKEMRLAIPVQLGALALAGICWISAAF